MKKSNNYSGHASKLSNRLLAVVLTALALSWGGAGYGQDFARMSERTIMGTARYVGMSGAMTAIGGDPSAAADNPAGLGLYRRPEVMISFDNAWDRTWQNPNQKTRRSQIMVPQASIVLSFGPFSADDTGVQYNNLMISYRRLHSYYRSFRATGGPDATLGAIVASTGVDLSIPYTTDLIHAGSELQIDEAGTVNEFDVDWAINISNMWYVGFGVHMQTHSMVGNGKYYEDFDYFNQERLNYYNANITALSYSGVGANLSAGVIYRPLRWLRVGFSLQTPSLSTLSIYPNQGIWEARTDSVRFSYAPNDLVTTTKAFHMPLRLSTSVAFQYEHWGMVGLQYDYSHIFGEKDLHSLKAGLEVVPVTGLYINAGYCFEGTFTANNAVVAIDPTFDRQDAYFQRWRNTQYVSGAIGYRGRHGLVQAAYQYRWQGIDLYAHEAAMPYGINAATHRLVITIAWHRGW